MDELDKFQWEAPYKKMTAVQELQESNFLLDLYTKCHERVYKTKPVWPLGNLHLTLIQDIRRMATDKTPNLIEHYFKMKDDWFVKRCHALDVLKQNLDKVNIDYETKGKNIVRSEALKISTLVICEVCDEKNEWVGFPAELLGTTKRVCMKCRP